ncbi:MAG: sugar phosphate nucleotidyltransferase [Chlamydiota bacterium]
MSLLLDNKQINIASIVLAGGKGSRLFPLTLMHSKPAVSYGGRYRLIDVPISNSLNSNIRQIFVIGQYLTSELQHHLSLTYHFDNFLTGMIDFITPEERPNGEKVWFEGTADAIRKNLDTILNLPVDYFLILSGDQLYNINFRKMLEFTIETDANLTIACLPVLEKDSQRMGILKIDSNSFVTDFVEKPKDPSLLVSFEIPEIIKKTYNISKEKYLGSMGIYIFKREALRSLLLEDTRDDFGKHLIPTEIKKGKTAAFYYDGYWEDIGTVESYYKANLALTDPAFKGLKMYDEQNPIYTQSNHLPGAQIFSTQVDHSIICEGSMVEAKEIINSIIGLRSSIKKGTVIHNSIIMGNNFYLSPAHQTNYVQERFEIGENCIIKKCIIDEHVCLGKNVQLINKDQLKTYDGKGIYVRDGIIIVTAGTRIPNNFIF